LRTTRSVCLYHQKVSLIVRGGARERRRIVTDRRPRPWELAVFSQRKTTLRNLWNNNGGNGGSEHTQHWCENLLKKLEEEKSKKGLAVAVGSARRTPLSCDLLWSSSFGPTPRRRPPRRGSSNQFTSYCIWAPFTSIPSMRPAARPTAGPPRFGAWSVVESAVSGDGEGAAGDGAGAGPP